VSFYRLEYLLKCGLVPSPPCPGHRAGGPSRGKQIRKASKLQAKFDRGFAALAKFPQPRTCAPSAIGHRGEGPPKKTDGPPCTFDKSQTHPPTIRLFFLVRFWGFIGKGSSKTPHKYFCKKSMSTAAPKTNRQKFDVNFSLTFCFIAFSGVSQRWEFKNTTKNVLQKKSCRKVFTKNSKKNPKPIFSRFCFITFLGVLGER
jgi:hypothetical protein